MCDYSLAGVKSRLAKEGDDLVVHRFWTGSMGLTPFRPASTDPASLREKAWCIVKLFLRGFRRETDIAVCIPPGAQLLVNDMPAHIQNAFDAGSTELVTFTQITASARAFRDAIRLWNGTEILLQRLREGQRVRVLHLPDSEADPTFEPEFEELAHAR